MKKEFNNWILLIIKHFTQNQVSQNALSNMMGKIWSAALSLLSIPIFLRYLGAEAYGLVGLYASFEVIFNFLDFGLSATVNREIARNIATNKPGKVSKNLLRTFEYFYWAIGFVVAVLITALARWIAHNWVIIHDLSPQQVQVSIYMMAFMFAARWPLTLYWGAFRGLQKQLLQNLISMIAATIRVFIAVMLLKYISHEVTIFVTWQAISCVIEIILLLLFAWKELNKISEEKPHIDLQIFKQVWKFALSFNIVGILGMILSQAGSLIGSKFVNLSEIGYYSVASTAAGSLGLIATSIAIAIFPRFSAGTANNDIKNVSIDFHHSIKIINYFTFGLGFILILFPSNVLSWWTRDLNVVHHTSVILIYLAIAGMFNSIANPSYMLLIASGNTKVPLLCNLANFIIFIPALVILLPKYGIISAAIVWLIENLIAYIIYVFFAFKIILSETFLMYLQLDVTPYIILSIFWFSIGKILCLLLGNEFIQLVVIIMVTIGYFLSLAPRIIREIFIKNMEIV